MHSEGYSSCPVYVCLCLCSTHLVLMQLNCKLDIVRLWTEYRVRSRMYNCSVAKLEHFLAKSVNHFVYMYVKRAILRTLYTTLPERNGLAL